ncbi:MAG: Spermidine Putrescine ABC transporter permease component potC (TC_3.A.1.11.1), partial [uncultured Nocardioidaceae bacterium]
DPLVQGAAGRRRGPRRAVPGAADLRPGAAVVHRRAHAALPAGLVLRAVVPQLLRVAAMARRSRPLPGSRPVDGRAEHGPRRADRDVLGQVAAPTAPVGERPGDRAGARAAGHRGHRDVRCPGGTGPEPVLPGARRRPHRPCSPGRRDRGPGERKDPRRDGRARCGKPGSQSGAGLRAHGAAGHRTGCGHRCALRLRDLVGRAGRLAVHHRSHVPDPPGPDVEPSTQHSRSDRGRGLDDAHHAEHHRARHGIPRHPSPLRPKAQTPV